MMYKKYIKEFREYMQLKNYSDRTISTYLSQLSMFLRFIEEYYPSVNEIILITRDVILDYLNYLLSVKNRKGRPLSNGTITNKIISIRKFFKFLIKYDYILKDPTSTIELPRSEKTLPRVLLDENEALELIKSIKTNTHQGLRNRAVIELFYSNGIRPSELCSLKVSDINFSDQTVIIYKGKGNKTRIAPITIYASYYIKEYIEKSRKFFLRYSKEDNNFLFLSKTGKQLNTNSINVSIMDQIRKESRIEKRITPYTLRHSIATTLIKRKVDIRYVQELLGHSSLDTTQRYTHLNIDDLKKVHSQAHPRETIDKSEDIK